MVLPYIHYILYCRNTIPHLASLHADPSHSCTRYSPPSGGPCTYLGEQLVEEVRLGEEEEHRRWDTRDQLWPYLVWAVKRFLGEEESKDEELLYKLLVQDDVTRALAVIKADHDRDGTLSPAGKLELKKLQQLITATQGEHRRERNRKNLMPVLRMAVKAVLSEEESGDEELLSKLLETDGVPEALETLIAGVDSPAGEQAVEKLIHLIVATKEKQGRESTWCCTIL